MFSGPELGAVVRAIRPTRSRFTAAILGGLAASLFIFAIGAGWLAHLLHLSSTAAWRMAVVPFLPGELLKLIAAAGEYLLAVANCRASKKSDIENEARIPIMDFRPGSFSVRPSQNSTAAAA